MSLKNCIFLFTIILLTNGSTASTSRDANQYADALLYTSLQNGLRSVPSLDPSAMGVFIARTEERLFPMRVTITADYGNGTLTGLSQIFRMGDCATPNTTYGNTTSFRCNLSFHHLTALYDCRVKYGKMPTVRGKLNVTFSGPVATMEVNGTRNSTYPTLRRLLMDSLGRMVIHFSGLGPLSRQQRLLRDGVIRHVPTFVLGIFYGPFTYALAAAVNRTPLPSTIFNN